MVSLLMRLPFFFPAVIDWDESTLILLGQSILDGHLPYLKLWDNKPPLAFFSFALFIKMLGESIFAMRLAGTVCVVLVAYICCWVGETIWPRRQAGLVAGLLSISVISVAPSGQATMTETVALVPLMGALWILATRRLNLWELAGAGALLAVTALIRMNLLYVSLAVGIVILAVDFYKKRSWSQKANRQLAFVLGHCAVGLPVLLPYLYVGQLAQLWRGAVLAPLAYANSRSSLAQAFAQHGENMLELMEGSYGLLWSLSWGAALLGVIGVTVYWRQWSRSQRQAAGMTVVFSGAIALSILKSGATHGHYLIQLVPCVGLLAAVFFGAFMRSRKWQLAMIGLVILAIAAAAYPLTNVGYRTLIARIKADQAVLATGDVYDIADYLNRNRMADQPVYLMSDHIIYWFIDSEPMTKCTSHPSAIGKPYILPYCAEQPGGNMNSEMVRLLAQKPEFIVKYEGKPWYLHNKDEAWHLLRRTLEKNYRLIQVIHGREIYKRLSLPSDPAS
jgi:4-amino-4-deoxy-L-arabinose transferase-like glycosyltransferase